MRGRRWVWKGGAFVVIAVAAVALLSAIVMSLWNELIPSLFKGPTIGFWQAAGLLVLSRILFGGFRGRGGHGRWRHGGPWRHGAPWGREWRERAWRDRWEAMTPEERDRLRAKFSRFGGACGWQEPGPADAAVKPDAAVTPDVAVKPDVAP